MLKLSSPTHTEKIILIPSQEEALKGLIEWTYFNDNAPFALIGSAGTGKTTILKEFINNCRYPPSQIAVTAPTHKAKKVVQKATGLDGQTIQALLGLRPDTSVEDFDITNPKFNPIAEKLIRMYRLVVIDESSMLNTDLHDMIVKEADKAGTKILFVGDELQLPPVEKGTKWGTTNKDTLSKALTQHKSVKLTEIIRQSNTNPITPLLVIIRECIINKDITEFTNYITNNPTALNDKGEGYELVDESTFVNKLSDNYKSPEFIENNDHCKFVAWTNECVTSYNAGIRKVLFPNTESVLDIGDLLMGYSTVYNEYNEILITNSEDYIVTACEPLTLPDTEIQIYRTTIMNPSIGVYSAVTIDIVDPNNTGRFLAIANNLLSTAKLKKTGRYWAEYYKFKNKHMLIKNILDDNKKLIVKKDIDYGYAITVHKTQGSTYENVYVHLPNIYKNYDVVDRMKLIYVALSRASKKTTILKL